MVKTDVTHVTSTRVHTFMLVCTKNQTRKTNMWILACLGFRTCGSYMCACRHIHKYIWLHGENFSWRHSWESPDEARGEPRWLMGDVVRRKSRHTQICVWEKKTSTVKQRRVLRQSLNCNKNRAPLFSLVFLKALQSRWSWAVVWWGKDAICWSTAGITTQEEEKRKRARKGRGGGEVLYSPDSPAIWVALRDKHK